MEKYRDKERKEKHPTFKKIVNYLLEGGLMGCISEASLALSSMILLENWKPLVKV